MYRTSPSQKSVPSVSLGETKAKVWYPDPVKRCTVAMYGKDMLTHTFECYAASLFDAAEKALQQWSLFWWHNPEALLEVRSGGDRWKVSQSRVREARKTKRG
jgi:hypothetical protein